MDCSRCVEEAVIKQGNQWLCAKHYRFGQMRAKAKSCGKTVPTHSALELLVDEKMICQDCGVKMNWRSVDGMCTVASLQHYRDGSFGIVCRTCNTRHAHMPGDTYREIEKNHKLCSGCNSIKEFSEFYVDAGRSGNMKIKSKCKVCSDNLTKEWRAKQNEKYNEYQREYREKRKAKGNPVTRKS